MTPEEIFLSAIQYETKIRDLYLSAVDIVHDERGKEIFKTLAKDEQSHIDFLENGLEVLKADGRIDPAVLNSSIPPKDLYEAQIEAMRKQIPENILGDVKRVLSSALKLEIETSRFYADARDKTQGPIREVFEKLLEIERRHEEVVQIELDHASNYGCWFNFMEIDMEY
ncbi:MAG: rubrerythrin [Desulfobacteraceae bacterium]|nr:MAG: rubrerythrin [Desulfobacteraceae bacterium]